MGFVKKFGSKEYSRNLELYQIPLTILCDNKVSISIAKNPIQHDITKHMEIDHHFIKEKIEGGIVRLMYTPSSYQTRDILTKALPKTTMGTCKGSWEC